MPTPLDLASARPGPAAHQSGRSRFEAAIRRSGIFPNARLTALTLATWAETGSGQIPTYAMPSMRDLVQATGLDEKAVRHSLRFLDSRGLIQRVPGTPDSVSQTRLLIPPPAPDTSEMNGRAAAARPSRP